eukprot:jgi/Botrbrau1/14185/Bobra.182_3s0118.1
MLFAGCHFGLWRVGESVPVQKCGGPHKPLQPSSSFSLQSIDQQLILCVAQVHRSGGRCLPYKGTQDLRSVQAGRYMSWDAMTLRPWTLFALGCEVLESLTYQTRREF